MGFVMIEGMEASGSMARKATVHCLIGCGIGEVLGMVLGTAFDWSNLTTVVTSVVLAFIFGFSLTMLPLLRANMSLVAALQTAFASDAVSITTMEIVDNLVIVVVPGALAASLTDGLFWVTLAASLAIAFCVTVPVNYWLIKRGKGHAVMHEHHH
jgi:hypothetical protein